MKILRSVLLAVLILTAALSLFSCSVFDAKWEDAVFTFFGDDIITWNSDAEADKYQVYIDGELFKETADEYCLLDWDAGEHALKVVKVKGGRNFVSEEMAYTKAEKNRTSVNSFTSLNENYLSDGEYRLGSLKYDEVILNIGKADFENRPLVLSSSLNTLHIIGGNFDRFSIKIEERSAPLTLIFDGVTVNSHRISAIYTNSQSEFETTVISLGDCSFSNTSNGADGADGAWGGGVQAGNGGSGINGGSIFVLPKVKFFTERQPTFSTGNGGDGGDGGSATNAFTHGGYAGNGGDGGFAFKTSSLICFNARYMEYGGSFGSGGAGGKGGYGNFSGTRPNGANGQAGAFSNITPTYISRTDGIIPSLDGDKNDIGFPISYVNGYLLWTEQPSASRYEITVNGNVVKTVTDNVCYAENISGITTGEVRVKAIYSDNSPRLYEQSKTLKIYDEEFDGISPETVSEQISGGAHIIIDAERLTEISSLTVNPQVKRLTINGNGEEINLSISASGRNDNLIIDLINITLSAPSGKTAISLNDGNGAEDGSNPILILNLDDATVEGGNGKAGAKGKDADGFFAFGADGEDGGRGADGVKAYHLALMGNGGAVCGGKGGAGGAGGDAATNNGGDGGKGGAGGTGAAANTIYVIMNEETGTVHINGGRGGAGGARGDGFGDLLDSSNPGSAGSAGSATSGVLKKYVGSITD